jgi:hypothetical protein
LALLGSLVLALTLSKPAGAGVVQGNVTWNGRGVAAALVEVYIKADRDPLIPPAAQAFTNEHGAFRLDLEAGRYWLWARASVPGAGREIRLAGEASNNPIVVYDDVRPGIVIPLADATGFARAGPVGTGARGSVSGAPPAEVFVYAYRGHSERPLGPGFVTSARPEPDGAFEIHLEPGRYTLAARWRASGLGFGALTVGDKVATVTVKVPPSTYVDAPALFLRPVDPAVLATLATGSPDTGNAISGQVVDGQGRPVAGIRVLAFTDARMAGKPLVISSATGSDGAYRVNLPGPDNYFLGARSRVGGPAEPGEKVGAHRGEDGAGLRVTNGQVLEGVTITVEEIW